ncbi:MAG: ISL3 family transposase [Phycisphaerae bacterium]|nr:ISL3 family transposase [Saprospiraceae bacterium]
MFLCCAKQPFSEVGALLNMQAKTVEWIYYAQGEKQLNLRKNYAQVRRLGIDEIAHRKGKGDFCCVLTDLNKNIQLDILPDRKKATLITHFQLLDDDFCQQIQAVSCDIWESYILASQQCFPNASITIDRFHVVKALNQSLGSHRKYLRKTFPKEPVFKDIKWTLFKARLCPREEENLPVTFQKNTALEQLVTLRNKFHHLFETAPNAKGLYHQLSQWKEEAERVAIPVLNKFLKTLKNWQQFIANFAESRLTNAATEGLNNIIRYIKRISFGLPNFQHLRLRVLFNYL